MSQIANLFGGGGSIVPGTTPIVPSTNKAVLFDDGGFVGENAGFLFDKSTGLLTAPNLTLTANGAASTPAQKLTGTWFSGGSSTTTKPQFLIEPAGTATTAWSTGGTGIGVNAASGFSGNLIDAQVAASSKFSVSMSGQVRTVVGEVSDTGYAWATGSTSGAVLGNANAISGVQMGSTGILSWGTGGPLGQTVDLKFQRDAANSAGQRNGAAAQKMRVYNAFTSSTNFETYVEDWITTANVCLVGTSKGSGGGAARALSLIAGDVIGLTLDTGSNVVVASGKNLTLGNAATTGLTAGVLAALTNATIVILDATGQAYRVPCII